MDDMYSLFLVIEINSTNSEIWSAKYNISI